MISTKNIRNTYRSIFLTTSCITVGLMPMTSQAYDENASDDTVLYTYFNNSDWRAGICSKTSQRLFKACKLDSQKNKRIETAKCINLTNQDSSRTCKRNTKEAEIEALHQCKEILEARNTVCNQLGDGAFDPVIDPNNFVSGIDNPYTPFQPGAFRLYEKITDEGVERIRVEVLPETREILGVTVTTLRDTVTLDGVLVEDTLDWLAQDKDGNVWYFGEIVQNYEEGRLTDLDGSFEAGKNGAKPGLWSKFAPQVGDVYRQEWDLDNAEDIVEVLNVDARDKDVPFSEYATGPILKTLDTTPLSPGAIEYKYYVPGIGFALEIEPVSGERLELIDYGPR